MNAYTTITLRSQGHGLHISRSTVRTRYNAINREMAAELLRRIPQGAGTRAEVGVVVLSGQGKAFCTGGDLSGVPVPGRASESLNWLAHDGYDISKAIELCEKVVIAKMKGYCLAGGLELALMCDLIYARESAKFGTTEINMGILPGWGGTVRIARAMPIYRAREIIYSGRKDYPGPGHVRDGLSDPRVQG